MSAPRGWAGSYALAAVLTFVVAAGSFVGYRNDAFRARETGRARAAAAMVARGLPAPPEAVAADLVLPAEPSARYPFLRRRQLASGRALGGAGAPFTDKLLYDAAGRAEAGGAYAAMIPGSELVLAAQPIPAHPQPGAAAGRAESSGGVAVAVTRPPQGPEGFPFLVVFGLLAIGALVAAAGALVGGRARPLGLALGACGLAVPATLWRGPVPGVLILAIAGAVAWAEHRGHLARAGAELRRQRAAYTFLGPAALAMLILVAVPFVIGLVLGFYDHHHGEWTYVGLDNFAEILSGGGRSLDEPLNFWFTLGVTVLWTAVNLVLHVTLGVTLALLLRQKWLRGRTAFRMLLILPWAIPNYITGLIWHGMFDEQHGAIDSLLSLFGIDQVHWFSSWATSFTANVVTNTWLGFPFMMVVALGALESIPRELDEAAEVDGASAWQRFRHVTLPHLRPALAPAVVLGAIWTFNMFNVIYLVSDGRPNGSTDILVTEAYRWAFERGERYGLASAYAVLIFLVLLLWTVFGTRVLRRRE
ncbi:MAG TPA: sugar ABC transporter permease, partial [Kofleriaceae bacterium]|nr:sugar ABC transporter permease [Kofleriaceae bacterium]